MPVMRDRAMQALYLLALDPVAQTTADPNSYGFRPQRSTADAIMQCYLVLGRQTAPQWILEGDIKSCFDKISHEWLLSHIPMEKAVLRKWLKAGYMDKHVLHPTDEGTPQGGIISPVLANMTLDGLERLLKEHFPKGVSFSRYADDFIVTGTSKDLLEQSVKPLVEDFMQERGLHLSPEKTCVTHIQDGFDFLGQNVRKYKEGKRYKILIKPSKKSVHALLEKIRTIVKKNKALPAGKLILLINPILRGWTQYHQHQVSKKIFQSIDDAIFHLLRWWIKRRHPGKSYTWMTKKYFTSVGGYNWTFHGQVNGHNVYLLKAGRVPIRRHVKIKGDANPYDPAWEMYYEKRLDNVTHTSYKGKQWLIHLWQKQYGFCALCHQKVTKQTGWQTHHVLWRCKGGSDSLANRVLLHPDCHQQIHSQGFYVRRPRPLRGVGKA
ncbi:MAG TPA: reverse transcriptase domain-containing protein [Ktedonobacteraceae bacterium]|nr:reverse transcriptase domain-containing protein [Ktedonobacteraceae bacterium]